MIKIYAFNSDFFLKSALPGYTQREAECEEHFSMVKKKKLPFDLFVAAL